MIALQPTNKLAVNHFMINIRDFMRKMMNFVNDGFYAKEMMHFAGD